MLTRNLFQVAALAGTLSFSLLAQVDRVPTGTEISVRTNESIDARHPSDSRIYTGVVDRDVLDNSGRVVIPRGSDAELILRDTGDNNVAVDLESVNVNGRRYIIDSTPTQVATQGSDRKEGVGANKRTGKYVGGGAVIGSIIGAIAGGGKGAAIGAATGAGAGAVGQTVTKGSSVKVPAETLLTFRLDQSMTVGGRDDGYSRDGRHYHRYDTNPRNDADRRR